jgi:ATP-dependent Clp protease ATP-binding subunit ClpA
MISADLQASFDRAIVDARELRYETLSVEQLLLALLRNPRAADVLRASAVNVDELHLSLSTIVRDNTPVAAGTAPVNPQASTEFQRVIQRAIILVDATRGRVATSTGIRRAIWRVTVRILAAFGTFIGRGTVDGADALVAIFFEKESLAVKELRRYGVTRFEVTNYIAHGVRRSDPPEQQAIREGFRGDANVVLFNDNFTPMEFVVKVLREHFDLSLDAAVPIMLRIHREGRAVCGRFVASVATEKVELVRAAARAEEHPLRCVAE